MDYPKGESAAAEIRKKGLSYAFSFLLSLLALSIVAPASAQIYSTSSIVVTATVNNAGGSTPPPSGGGGGGGGGGSGSRDSFGNSQVQFKGRAYPGSKVTLLKDGKVAASVPASPDGNFNIGLTGLSNGRYTFGVWGEDNRSLRSSTQTFNVDVSSDVTTVVTGIFLPPTITVDKLEVRRGDVLTILGQSAPEAVVNLFVHSDEELVKKVRADASGAWLYQLDTLEVALGDHLTKARSTDGNNVSLFSKSIGFKVGNSNVALSKDAPKIRSDSNHDGRVNLVDFSILAYWYKRPIDAETLATVDLNDDGAVDIVDFSIMAYEWTG